jgi:chromosome segregation ATPase
MAGEAYSPRGIGPLRGIGAVVHTGTIRDWRIMADTADTPIELDAAERDLLAAIERLEARLDGLFERLDSRRPLEREAEALRLDRARLASDLDAARARERELQMLADEASEALGAAISEVREALGKV